MSSPFEGLTDSWQDRQERDRRAAKRLRRDIYRVAALVAGAAIGAGVGSVVEAGDTSQAVRRIGGAVIFGPLMAGIFFAGIARRVVGAQMFGRESSVDSGWVWVAAPVCGAGLGGAIGSVLLLPSATRSVGYSGGQAGAIVGAALVWVAWRLTLGRTRRWS